jgi:hypothetical protein
MVAWNDGSGLVGFLHETEFKFSVASIDPFDCTDCEGVFVLQDALAAGPSIASEVDGGGVGSTAVCCWEIAGRVFSRAYRADDGVVADLGGGCGGGGTALATCAVVGNADFDFRLRSATPGAAAWLVLSAGVLGTSCGSCRLIPDPFRSGFVLPAGSVDARGDALVSVPIPNRPTLLGGARFYGQWLVGGSECGVFDLSNAISIQIQ